MRLLIAAVLFGMSRAVTVPRRFSDVEPYHENEVQSRIRCMLAAADA
jgi:hypothetical protein